MVDGGGSDEVATHHYQPDDEDEIIALLTSSFPFWEKLADPKKYWRWKYVQNPQETSVIVSTVGGRLAGVGHCIKMRVRLGDRVLTSYFDDDYATYPEYRKKGVYKAITNHIDAVKLEGGADFCYWITTNPVVLTKAQIHEQVGFPTPFSDLVKVRDVDEFIEKLPIEDAIAFRASYHSRETPPPIHGGEDGDIQFIEVPTFDERFDKFWDEASEDYGYFFLRDRAYMNWRFAGNPRRNYTIKAAVSGGEVVGYVVLELDDYEGYMVGAIYDMLPARGHPNAVLPLFKEVIRHFDALGINCVSLTTMQGGPYHRVASSLGFIDAPYATESYVRFWGYNDYFYDTLEKLGPERIYFSYADYF
jgi:hypothetical protein